MQHKVRIVRFWLLAIFAIAWACLVRDPTFGLIPILFFPGQAGCFCCIAVLCGGCNTGFTNQYQIDISGISDDGATCGDCNQFNGTYVVTKVLGTEIPGQNGLSTDCYAQFIISPCYCVGVTDHAANAKYATNNILFAVVASGTSSIPVVRFSGHAGAAGSGTCSPFDPQNYSPHFNWQDSAIATLNCGELSSYSVPFDNRGTVNTGCQSDSSPALVTTL